MLLKRSLIFFFFSLLIFFQDIFAQEKANAFNSDLFLENAPTLANSNSSKEKESEGKYKQIVETFQWGLENQITSNLRFLIQEKDASYAEAVKKLYQENPTASYNFLIFEYFLGIEDSSLLNEASDILRYYDLESDELMNRVLDYFVFLKKKGLTDSIEDFDEILWNLYESGSALLQNKILKSIGEMNLINFLPKLKTLYEDFALDSKLKPQILKTIGALTSNEDLTFFTELLKNDLPKSEKWACCEVLAKSGDDSIYKTLVHFYQSGEPYLRLTITENLGNFNEENCLQFIQFGLKDDFWRVRKKAIALCVEKKYSRLIPQLIFKVKTEPESVVKQEAIKALGSIQTDEAFQFLKESLFSGKINLSVQKILVRSLFAYPIDQYQIDLIEWIKKEEKNENKLIPIIAATVGELAETGYEPLIEYFLYHSNPAIQHSAILAMIRLEKILQEDKVESIRKKNSKNYLGTTIDRLYKTVGKEIPESENSQKKKKTD